MSEEDRLRREVARGAGSVVIQRLLALVQAREGGHEGSAPYTLRLAFRGPVPSLEDVAAVFDEDVLAHANLRRGKVARSGLVVRVDFFVAALGTRVRLEGAADAALNDLSPRMAHWEHDGVRRLDLD